MSRRLAVAGLPFLLLFATMPAPAGEIDAIRDHLDRGMIRSARALLAAALESDPDDHRAHGLAAELALGEEDHDAAEAAARKAIALDELNVRYRILWARARLAQAKAARVEGRDEKAVDELFAQAETGFRNVLALDPYDPEALGGIGQAREWRGLPGAAEQFYESQIREFPRLPDGYVLLGKLRANRGEPEAALATFERGLEAAGENAGILYARGVLLAEQGESARAKESFTRAVRADPGALRAWRRLEAMAGDRGRSLLPLALEILEEHPAAAHPAWLAGYWTLNDESRKDARRRNEEVLRIVLPALEVHGEHEELAKMASKAAAFLIGNTPKSAPNAKAAVDAFRRIHEAWPFSGDAANNLGYYYRETGDYDASLDWYLKAVKRAPESQDILNDTGLMYLFHFPGREAKGLPYFLKTVALVAEGDQKPERGYWDALENLCKHYLEVDLDPAKVLAYAKMRYETTKGVEPYNRSPVARRHAERARRLLGR